MGSMLFGRLKIVRFGERLISSIALDDDRPFLYRQIVGGIDDGMVLVADYAGSIVAAVLAQTQGDVLKLIDLRVDFDHRREGFGNSDAVPSDSGWKRIKAARGFDRNFGQQ